MNTENTNPQPEEFEVTIVPDDMTVAFDADGLPRAEPVEKAEVTPPVKKAPAVDKAKKDQDALVKALQTERDQRIAEANRARAEANAAIQAAAAERQARAQAERQAAEASSDADRFTDIASRAHMTALHTRLENYRSQAESAKSTIAQIKREMVTAQENADHTRFAELQEQMAKATNFEITYSNAANEYEDRIRDAEARFRAGAQQRAQQPSPKQPAEQQPQQQQPQRQAPKTADEWIDAAAPAIGNGASNWLREHKEYVTDGAKHQQLRKFTEYYAARNGGPTSIKSDAFVAALNKEFFADQQEEEVDEQEEETPAVEQKPVQRTPAAPVSRGAPAKSSNQSANRIEMTPMEATLAVEQWKKEDWDLFDPSVKAKFKEWSPNAARWQYHAMKQRGEKEGKFRG